MRARAGGDSVTPDPGERRQGRAVPQGAGGLDALPRRLQAGTRDWHVVHGVPLAGPDPITVELEAPLVVLSLRRRAAPLLGSSSRSAPHRRERPNRRCPSQVRPRQRRAGATTTAAGCSEIPGWSSPIEPEGTKEDVRGSTGSCPRDGDQERAPLRPLLPPRVPQPARSCPLPSDPPPHVSSHVPDDGRAAARPAAITRRSRQSTATIVPRSAPRRQAHLPGRRRQGPPVARYPCPCCVSP